MMMLTRQNSSGQLLNLQGGTVHVLNGKLKDGTSVAGVYASGTARNNSVFLDLNFLIDNSGSMGITCGHGKTRLQVVLGCMDSMLRSPIVQPNDHVKVHTCNGAVNLRLSCFASKYDHARLETSITERPGNPSSTRLWDGINVTYKDMLKHDEIAQNGRTVLRYMLVFTDGGDNASRMDVDELAGCLRRPGLANFHVVVIAAGLDTDDAAKLNTLLQPRHCKLISVQSTSELDIQAAFKEANSHIRTLILQMGRQVISTNYSGNSRGAQKFDNSIIASLQSQFKALSVTGPAANNFLTFGNNGQGNNRCPSAQRGRTSNSGSNGGNGHGRSQSRRRHRSNSRRR